MFVFRTALQAVLMATALVLLTSAAQPASALDAATASADAPTYLEPSPSAQLPALGLKEALVLEDREGYNGEYLFGMTKAVVNSTLHPAVKPLVFILTLPIDLALSPFAAIAGFF